MAPTEPAIVCIACGHAGTLGAGPGGRPRASCRQCGSLERERALVGLLPGLVVAASRGCVVEVAPSRHTSRHVRDLASAAGAVYLGLDFDPSADRRTVNVQASLTAVPLADASVGLLICFHVLEHIPDDASAMAEISRILAPGGVAVVQVPRRRGVQTEEDPGASPEERVVRFGQADHVRLYGDDFEVRLAAAGLEVVSVRAETLYRELGSEILGIPGAETLWFCTRADRFDVNALALSCESNARKATAAGLARLVADRDDVQRRLDSLRTAGAATRDGACQQSPQIRGRSGDLSRRLRKHYMRLRRKVAKALSSVVR